MFTNKILFLAALFSMLAWSQAQVIWARPNGTPCPPGCAVCTGTFACPVASIQDALNLLPWGGTVRLFSGAYTINNPALTSGSFTILGNGTQTGINCAGAPGFRVFNGNAQFTNFVIGNCARPGGNGGAFNVQGAFASFSGVNILDSGAARGAGIYVENGSVNLDNASRLFNNVATITGGGLFLSSANANLAANVIIQNNSPNDVRCTGGSFNGGVIGTSSCLNCGACTTP